MYMDETYGNSMKPPSIIYATSGVGSAGIDSPNIILVFRIDMPPSIFGLFQEKGRSGRHPLASAGDHWYVMCFSLESMIFFFKWIIDPRGAFIENYYFHQQLDDLFYIGMVLASKGWYAVALEYVMGNPLKISPQFPTCGRCANCAKKPLFPSIWRVGCSQILFGLLAAGPHAITELRTVNNVLKAIPEYPNFNELLFQIATKKIEFSKIKKVLFVMISCGLLEAIYRGGDIIIWLAASRISDTVHLSYEYDGCWCNLHLKPHLNMNGILTLNKPIDVITNIFPWRCMHIYLIYPLK